MEIITSHNALDFDGLAGMVAAGKLYPGAVKAFSGTVAKNVKQFMALYKDSLSIKQAREIELHQVERLIIVDTAIANRLGQFKQLANDVQTELHIYDHHPVTNDNLSGVVTQIEPLGAATTILVEEIQKQNIALSPFDATILALGIYEDTGSLLFSSTTPRDAAAVAFLLARGANLAVVANFMEQPFSEEQRQVLQSLMENSRHYKVNNVNLVIAVSDSDEFIPGLDAVSHQLFEVENCDAVFIVALMEGKVNVVGRSRSNSVKINEILKPWGGRGHEKAASVVIKGKTSSEVAAMILSGLDEKIHPAVVARDIMSTPVKTIPMYITMKEAGGIMLRYGHTGMPVVEGDSMVGVISRRDVDKAMIHELGHAPVKGFMTTQVLSVSPETTVDEIQKLMVEHDIGRLPVIDSERLVGIVSRTDILRILHGDDYPEDHEILYTFNEGEKINLSTLMQDRLPSRILYMMELAGEIASDMQCTVYSVGGFVRDMLLRVANFDVDLVVEGEGTELACKLAERLGGKARIHERFHTAAVKLPDGTKIDVATARTEYYEFPAALPRVERSSIKEDMYRRDFTINTLAICLNPDKFGDLIDYFGGQKDLENGCIRILYNLSFVEDPTRILRAIRFEQRYRFKIEADTLRFARDAIDRRLLGELSYKRILQELILILSEKDPVPSLKRMKEIGVWKYILPEVKLEDLNETTLKRISVVMGWWDERYFRTDTRRWLVYIMYIISNLSEVQIENVLNRYPLDSHAQRCIRESKQISWLAGEVMHQREWQPSALNRYLDNLTVEELVYLLLCLNDEISWETVVNYLDRKELVKVDINGNDLKNLGIKTGPVYKQILDKLYDLKLDGVISSREDEIEMVCHWMKEGDLASAIN